LAAAAAFFCALIASLLVVAAASAEEADTAPIQEYDSGAFFWITGPESPERFPLRVTLDEEQFLEQVSPTEVEAEYAGHGLAFRIVAAKAHDADGANVQTTLELTGRDLVTLVVHHRAGNPAAGGAPFDYPVTEGEGWEGGFQTIIVKGPPDETELREMSERERIEKMITEASPAAQVEPPPVITCRVPTLRGYSLHGAKNRLRAAHCGIGAVHLGTGATAGDGKVVKQFHPAGTELAAGAPVAVKLGTAASR
jgi:hypothetical protein